MKVTEFLAFIEGMDIEGAPTERQWEKIVEKLRILRPDILRVNLGTAHTYDAATLTYRTQITPSPAYPQQGTGYHHNQYQTVTSSGTNMLGAMNNVLGVGLK